MYGIRIMVREVQTSEERSLVGVALDLAPEFTLGYRMPVVGTWGWVNSKIRRRWSHSPSRQFNLAGAHVNPDELRQFDGWFSLTSDIASRLAITAIPGVMLRATYTLKILGIG